MQFKTVISLSLCFSVLFTQAAFASPYALIKDPERKRDETNAFISILLPGFAQWREGQTGYGFLYSGLGLAGLGYGLSAYAWDDNGPTFRGESRNVQAGLSIYTTAGGMSAHHGFRTAVRAMQKDGRYDFLKIEESPLELALSPLRFDYLIRPTTLVPLALSAALFFWILPKSSETVALNNVKAGDAAFTGVVSYGAGTAEESIFRGMVMPALADRWGKPFMANLATAGIFALAHISPDNLFVPWPQFIGGLYFGWVSQFRDWTLSESIFIHCWYDVLVFTAAYATNPRGNLKVSLPPIVIPF